MKISCVIAAAGTFCSPFGGPAVSGKNARLPKKTTKTTRRNGSLKHRPQRRRMGRFLIRDVFSCEWPGPGDPRLSDCQAPHRPRAPPTASEVFRRPPKMPKSTLLMIRAPLSPCLTENQRRRTDTRALTASHPPPVARRLSAHLAYGRRKCKLLFRSLPDPSLQS